MSSPTEAISLAAARQPNLIVLDNDLQGQMTGLDAAPHLRAAAPAAAVVMFSATEEVRIPARKSPSIDGFVPKTDIGRLVSVARELLNL